MSERSNRRSSSTLRWLVIVLLLITLTGLASAAWAFVQSSRVVSQLDAIPRPPGCGHAPFEIYSYMPDESRFYRRFGYTTQAPEWIENLLGEHYTMCMFGRIFYFDAEATDITDSQVALLRQFPDLVIVNIRNCSKITDTSLKHIGEMDRCRYLNLSQCKGISENGTVRLRTMRPKLKIALR